MARTWAKQRCSRLQGTGVAVQFLVDLCRCCFASTDKKGMLTLDSSNTLRHESSDTTDQRRFGLHTAPPAQRCLILCHCGLKHLDPCWFLVANATKLVIGTKRSGWRWKSRGEFVALRILFSTLAKRYDPIGPICCHPLVRSAPPGRDKGRRFDDRCRSMKG